MKKMKLHWIFWVVLAVAMISVAIFMIPKSSNGKECKIDSDCVRASCCHATSCVAAENAPDCSDIFCSQECVPNTLDCGQGSCACNEGVCGVK